MLVELQTKLSFQEDLLQQLDTIVTRQQNQIDELRRELKFCTEQTSEVLATVNQMDGGEQNEKPPHY